MRPPATHLLLAAAAAAAVLALAAASGSPLTPLTPPLTPPPPPPPLHSLAAFDSPSLAAAPLPSLPPDLPVPADELQAHGTTTLAFRCKRGIILAVDSRASIGKYVGSRTTRKVFPISRHVVATMAGGAADCTYWIRLCTRIAKLHEYSAGAPLSVASLAAMLAKRLREMRHAKLSVGTMVAGWDTHGGGGASLFYVDSEGSCIPGSSFCVGSGANLAYSILDAENLSELDSVEEAVELATWAIRHATNRDGFSGGFINVFHINSTGLHHLRRTDSVSLAVR